MKINFIIILLAFCQFVVFAQDKNVTKIAEYIKEKKDNKAKDLLDKLDGKSEYQSDISFWFVRTAYYRNIAVENPNSQSDLAEARKSYEKLVELDKNDQKKIYSKYLPSLKKDLFEGKNQITIKGSDSKTISESQTSDGNTVILTQIGEGKTKDAAKYNALRNAIEKAFGTFISSNTTILNDELTKDEIVSVASGNIQSFEILSETQMPDGSFSSVVKATVSIGKLTTFCENKGITVEFKGGLFAANIKLQELNIKNEEAVMTNLFTILNIIIANGFDYTIEASDPINSNFIESFWLVPLKVKAKLNNNMANISTIIESTLKGVTMSPSEVEKYKKQNLSVYNISFNNEYYSFRSYYASYFLKYITTITIPIESLNFKINNGIYDKSWFDFSTCVQNRTGGYEKPSVTRIDNVITECNYVNLRYFHDWLECFYSLSELGKGTMGWLDVDKIINNFNPYNKDEYINAKFEVGKSITFNFEDISKNEFVFNFSNLLHISDLEKITEYKVQPIIK